MVAMQLIDLRGGYLYQHRPDVVPQGHITPDEVALWAAYYERKNQKG